MFLVPGSDIKTVHITSACVLGKDKPLYLRNEDATDDDNDTKNYEEGAKVRASQ